MLTFNEFKEKYRGLTTEEFRIKIIEQGERLPHINIKQLGEIIGDRKNVEIIPYDDDGEIRWRCFVILEEGILDLDMMEYSEVLLSEESQLISKLVGELMNQGTLRSNSFTLESFQNARKFFEQKVNFLTRLESHFIEKC